MWLFRCVMLEKNYVLRHYVTFFLKWDAYSKWHFLANSFQSHLLWNVLYRHFKLIKKIKPRLCSSHPLKSCKSKHESSDTIKTPLEIWAVSRVAAERRLHQWIVISFLMVSLITTRLQHANTWMNESNLQKVQSYMLCCVCLQLSEYFINHWPASPTISI